MLNSPAVLGHNSIPFQRVLEVLSWSCSLKRLQSEKSLFMKMVAKNRVRALDRLNLVEVVRFV